MERIEWKGDFLGFTFGGVHSSSLGIVRTSDGSRYNENLLPEFEDKTVKVPGRDETYYFGSEYKQRTFEVKIAFDNMTDKQFRQLRQLMSGQELKDLIFDEAPYKVYKVKANGAPNLSYIAFDEEYRRIYKGEGTLNFIAYFPFARSRFKYKEDYTPKNIPEWGGIQDNKMSWLEASGIPSKSKTYNITLPAYDVGTQHYDASKTFSRTLGEIKNDNSDAWRTGTAFIITNPGDISVPLNFVIKTTSNTSFAYNYKIYARILSKNNITFSYDDEPFQCLEISIPSGAANRYFIFNGYSHLITAYQIIDNEKKDIDENFNDIIISGDFINIPPISDDKVILIHMDATTIDKYGFWASPYSCDNYYLYY